MSRAPARVHVLGADGMLGRAWLQQLRAGGIEHHGFALPQFDLTRATDLAALPLAPGDAVINCAAWTDVDGAEKDEAAATRVNGGAVASLAQRCADAGATLVHYSTDYVFDGQATAPYPVDGMHAPLSAYGRSKAAGERGLFAAGPSYLLVRTSWLYAPWGQNFVRTITKLARERPNLRVVDDQRGRPTSAEHLARASWRLLDAGCRGIVHVTDGEQCTWFEFATAIAAATAPQCRVDPCTTAEFPRPARRPAYSVLDLGRTEAAIGAMPSWRDNLADVLARLE
ncbi:MAG: dTDP-4-dehydrorhamnose reductase [Nannocystaceae bacterium]|nr:dTDP-4-dehydrorhamnose reductase [Nannocystaceae bacterium]